MTVHCPRFPKRSLSAVALLGTLVTSAGLEAEPPRFQLGFGTVAPSTKYILVPPEGEAPGLAILKITCDDYSQIANVPYQILLWSTLTSVAGPPEERARGWSIAFRAENAGLLSIDGGPLFAGLQTMGGFERSEITTGPGNDGAVSIVELPRDTTAVTLPASGTVPIAAIEIEVDTPAEGCAEATVRYEDGLRDSKGILIKNAVISETPGVLELTACSPRVCAIPPGQEHCSNARDDDGDSKVDLADSDCANSPHPGDCILSPCGCKELFVQSVSRVGDRFNIAFTNEVPIAAFEMSGRIRPAEGAFLFELTGDVPDDGGNIVGNVLIDGLGNRIPLPDPGTVQSPDNAVAGIARGPDLRAFDGGDSLAFGLGHGPEGSSFWVKYLADASGSTAVIPSNRTRAGCAPHDVLQVHVGHAFHRGDANSDGRLNITDPVGVLLSLFGGEAAPQCMDAADANDDGRLDLTDAVHLLLFLFRDGEPVAPPGPPGLPCGPDVSPSGLECRVYDAC